MRLCNCSLCNKQFYSVVYDIGSKRKILASTSLTKANNNKFPLKDNSCLNLLCSKCLNFVLTQPESFIIQYNLEIIK